MFKLKIPKEKAKFRKISAEKSGKLIIRIQENVI